MVFHFRASQMHPLDRFQARTILEDSNHYLENYLNIVQPEYLVTLAHPYASGMFILYNLPASLADFLSSFILALTWGTPRFCGCLHRFLADDIAGFMAISVFASFEYRSILICKYLFGPFFRGCQFNHIIIVIIPIQIQIQINCAINIIYPEFLPD